MSDTSHEQAHALLTTYERRIREALVRLGAPALPAIDQAASVLRDALAGQKELRIGFLGESQVGKSTLINALLGRTALPSGGVGPLTAQATRVAYAESGSLEVGYHSRQRFNQFVFALQHYLIARKELSPGAESALPAVPEGDAPPIWEPISGGDDDDDGDGAREANAKGKYLLSQARLMLCGSDEHAGVSAVTLLDGMRLALGLEPLADVAALAPYRTRIAEIKACLGAQRRFTDAELGGRKGLDAQIQLHAAGWLSPLVARLGLAIDNVLLRDITLVDLPGVGVVGDPAGHVAEEFVRKEADALVLVARNNGLTELIATVLERTGVITKLLFGGQGKIPPVHVMVVITQLDQVARDHYTRAHRSAREAGEKAPDRHAIFASLATQMADKVRQQISEALHGSSAFEDLSPENHARREAIINELCRSMDVLCTSAPDYNNILDDLTDVCFLKDEEATNIPEMKRRLRGLCERARGDQGMRVGAAYESFSSLLTESLRAMQQAPSQTGGVPAKGWASFREAIEAAAAPLKDRATQNRATTSKILSAVIPARLDALTTEAAAQANKRLGRLRTRGQAMHWRKLNAALLRNGVYERGGIDYPGDLTRVLVDTIAGSWESAVVAEVRKAVRDLLESDAALVEQLHGKAEALGGAAMPPALLAAQKRLFEQQARTAVDWTGDRLNELRKDISDHLYAVALKPIERACRKAVQGGRNRGSGARARILEDFETGSAEAIEGARTKAKEILNEHFQRLKRQLSASLLKEGQDPISAACAALLEERERAAEKASVEESAQRRAALAELAALVAAPRAVGAALPTPSQRAGHNLRRLGNDMFDDLEKEPS